jgi:putative FmdB family regulatory protein
MPIFEYRCDDCGTRFEKLVRRSEDATTLECPSCGDKRLTQELSTFATYAAPNKGASGPMCPSGGPCRTPDACGLN